MGKGIWTNSTAWSGAVLCVNGSRFGALAICAICPPVRRLREETAVKVGNPHFFVGFDSLRRYCRQFTDLFCDEEIVGVMKSEFLMAINQLSAERDLPVPVILEAVEAALVSAYKRDFGADQEVIAKVDPEGGKVQVFVQKEVVEEVQEERTEITLEEARKIDADAELEQVVSIESTPDDFGRIAAQTAKQVIMQRIREAERERIYADYVEKEDEIIIGTVRSVGDFGVILSLGKAEAHLPRSEQIPRERYRQGDRVKAYVSSVDKGTRGVKITVSRTHRNMLKRLLELEVPEIFNGTVEIKAIAREPGARSKVAVTSTQAGIDPVGSCVGMRGVRIQNIVSELNGEKIDVVEWGPDVATFIGNALSPARVLNVLLDESGGTRTATVIVPENQLSLAIGRAGQNARLAARLTGWRIDIKSATEVAEELLHRPARIVATEEKSRDLLSLAEDLLLEKSRAEAEEEVAEPAALEEAETPAAVEEGAPAEEVPEAEVVAEAEEKPVAEAEPEAEVEAPAEEVEELAEEVDVAEPVPEAEAEEPLEEVPEEVEEPALVLEPSLTEELKLHYGRDSDEGEDEEGYEGDSKKKRKKKGRGKKRRLVYDDESGEMVVQRVRKPSRRGEWEDYEE